MLDGVDGHDMVDWIENLIWHDHKLDLDFDVVENDQSCLMAMVENRKIHCKLDRWFVFDMENYVGNENRLNYPLDLIHE